MNKYIIVMSVAVQVLWLAGAASAQRGTGRPEGIARQKERSQIVTVRGTLKEIQTGPCEQTTGRAKVGTHLILKSKDGTLNVHVGATDEVKDIVSRARLGETVEAKVFRTEQMAADHCTAISLRLGDDEIVLRDAALRPTWAGSSRRPGRNNRQFASDRDVFHFLLANHERIQREVTQLKNGVQTVTRSDDTRIAAQIQEHVRAMYHRLEKGRPIRRRDPLFNELFKHADKMMMELEDIADGIRVVETSEDPYVVRLIQEHARVVSGFVDHGFEEARRNHAVPAAT